MSAFDLLGAVLALVIGGYLLLAMLRAEEF